MKEALLPGLREKVEHTRQQLEKYTGSQITLSKYHINSEYTATVVYEKENGQRVMVMMVLVAPRSEKRYWFAFTVDADHVLGFHAAVQQLQEVMTDNVRLRGGLTLE